MSGSDDHPRPAAPGPLLAAGRATDVYDVGDGRIVRRYRARHHLPRHEERVMRYVADHGVAVPAVYDLGPDHDPETDILMERIEGPTMLDDLARRPWMIVPHARVLSRLLRTIAAVPAPAWMLPDGSVDADRTRALGVVHLDLHPMNVIISSRGPVVIDWTNATGAPAGFDAAMSYVLMATFEVDDPRERWGQQLMVSLFRRAAGRAEIDAFLVAACDHRLADPAVTPGERVNVAALRAQARRRR